MTAALLVMGVRAVIPRNSSFDELASAFQATAEGLIVLGTDAAKTLAERLPHRGNIERPMPAEELTDNWRFWNCWLRALGTKRSLRVSAYRNTR
jgi:DNA-binding NarL/FixJ family response regulator